MKITTLQEAMLPVYRDRWLAHGLSCEPSDLERCKRAATLAYQAAGLEPPKLWLLLDSPLSGAIGAALLSGATGAQVAAQVRAQVRAQVDAQVWAPVRDQVWAPVRDQVRAQVGAQVRAQVWDQVWAPVRDQVWAPVRDQVWDQVRAQVRAQVWDQVDAQVAAQVRAQVRAQVWDQVDAQVGAQVRDQVRWAMLFSSHEAGYLGWHDFFLSELRLPDSAPMRGLIDLAKECGWWAPYKGVAIFQHRHCELHRDDRGQLHNESGMAVRYRDGFGVWAIHGTRVTERIVMQPESLTLQDIKAEKNAEVRRVMRERFGEGRYLRESGAKLIHADYETARKGAAPRALMLDDENQRWLVGTDGSTGRAYYMRAPDDAKTCREAHNALCGFDESKILNKS